jgi:integrase
VIAFGSKILSDHLPAILEQYLHARQLCSKQQERLRLHVRSFETWLVDHAHASPQDSDTTRLNGWLADLARSRAPATVNGYRQSIMALLRFATEDGVPLPRADRIRRQREPDRSRYAYTRDELRTLIEAASRYRPVSRRVYGRGLCVREILRTRPDGVPWSVWWEAYIRIGYESGQYLSDLRKIPWKHVGHDGVGSFVRHKTGKAMAFRLSEAAIRAARRIGHKELLLPWSYDLGAYFPREWKKFAAFAGVRVLEPKAIRRSAITYTYIEQGEEAARILAGHSSFATTSKHYIDWSIARRPIIQPPSLAL